MVGFQRSGSAYNTWLKAKDGTPDPVEIFLTEMKGAVDFQSLKDEYRLRYPVFLVLARKA